MFKKSFIIPIAIFAVAFPLMAQKAGQRILQPLRPAALKKALNLTPDQVSGLKALVQSNKAQRQAIGQNARQKAQTLRDLTSESNPNPTDVGNAVLALRQARSQAREMRQQTIDKFKSTLTPEQLKTLEDLQSGRRGRGNWK